MRKPICRRLSKTLEAKQRKNRMEKADLFKLYQQLYFHELEVKEKLITRLQMTFAFHATVFTIIAYMLRMFDYESKLFLICSFHSIIIIAVLAIIPSVFYTIDAFWGNTYKGIPSANETERFRKNSEKHELDMKKYHEDYPESINGVKTYLAKEELQDYLYEHYANCSSHNTEINDKRSLRLHSAIKWLLISALPLLAACLLFIRYDLDVSSPRKNLLIEDRSLTSSIEKIKEIVQERNGNELKITFSIERTEQLTDQETHDNKPAPPPPPERPGPRNIIEDHTPEPSADQTVITEDS